MAAIVLRVAPPVSSSSLRDTRRRETESSLCPSVSFSSSSSSFPQFPSLSFSATQPRSHRGFMVVAALPAYLKAKKTYTNVIYVSEISINTTKESLKTAFQKFGEIVNVNLVMNKSKNLPRGYGFIYYATEEEANKAIEEMNGQSLDGKTINVRAVEVKVEEESNVKVVEESNVTAVEESNVEAVVVS